MAYNDLPMGDKKIAQLISEGNTETSAALATLLATTPASFPDRGHTFLSNKTFKHKDFTAAIAGDSTGNAMDEWIDLYFASIATANPDLTVEIPHWNDTTQAYNAATLVQTGTPASTGIVFLDTFTRTAGEAYNTTPDIGSPWGRDGSNAAGDWTIDGSKLVRTSDTTSGVLLADAGVAGDTRVTMSGTLSTTNTGVQRLFRTYMTYKASTDHLYLQVTVTNAGTTTFSINKRIANTVTTVVTGGAGVLTANTASVPFTLSFERIGTQVSATVNGVTLSGAITAEDLTALESATLSGPSSSGHSQGDTIDNFQIEIVAAASPKKLTLLNASMSGSQLAYQQTRLTTLYPTSDSIDLLFISSCHNYGSNSASQYIALLDSFIKDYRAIHPESGIIISSQNPQKAPASGKANHLARLAALRSYAATRGYGYLPVTEAFLAQPNQGVALVASDGVHPTPGAANSGSSLWRDTVIAYFASL